MKTTLTSLLMLAAAGPALLADITVGSPAATVSGAPNTVTTPVATPQAPTRIMGNCDLLASNTVRASFLGVRAIQTQSFDQTTPTTVHVAVFQVLENLAYKRLVRYGDGSLKPGACFTVAMTRDLPGQPANIADTIAQMQPGEEAIMKIDHLYIFGDQEGKPIRPCSRMARRQGAMAPTAAPAAAPAPAQSEPQPAAPAQQGPDRHGDDTTVEQAPQNAAPQPALPAPAVPAAPKPVPAGESF